IVSKVLSYRLKSELKYIVSLLESSFTPGRFITDNVLIAFEIGHYLKRKRQGNKGEAALKLDMSKSIRSPRVEIPEKYDASIGIPSTMGQPYYAFSLFSKIYSGEKWGMRSTPSFPTVDLVNGIIFLLIFSLFLLRNGYAEARRGTLHGVQVARTEPSISNLFSR
ncbi:uncharacterized protein, partial [Primulina huaijiensis]|uniref:uncharacterized protein n=1 Tax=Primulina huaijiensis TaxID=1492673 RepID=UPI003CC6DFDA